jgi:Phosphate-starvation-inducible E family
VPRVDCQGMDRDPKSMRAMRALITILAAFEGIAYLAIAFALSVPVVMLVFSAVMSMLEVLEGGVFETALAVLDSLLLAFIFVELIDTIRIVASASEDRIFIAEPFLLVGLVAVVRGILLLTANLHQAQSMEESQILLIEVGILAFLVIVLSGALYFARRMRVSSEQKREISE